MERGSVSGAGCAWRVDWGWSSGLRDRSFCCRQQRRGQCGRGGGKQRGGWRICCRWRERFWRVSSVVDKPLDCCGRRSGGWRTVVVEALFARNRKETPKVDSGRIRNRREGHENTF